ADLDEAIEHHRAALDLHLEGHPDRSASLSNLAISLRTRFGQHGQSADLDEAIEYHRAALDLRPEGHPARSASLNNLAISLHTRYEQHGQNADLDEAIEYHRAALDLRPEGHPDRSGSLNNLAISLHTRYEQYGQSADLDEAIEYHRAALDLRPEGHPARSASLNNLAVSLQTRFEQHRQSADLDEAIEHHRAALELRPEGHPDRSTSLNNLAVSLQTRFEQHRQSADLDEAIEHHRAALELRPEGHLDRSTSLNNLAVSLQTRFEQHRQSADLDEAIEHHRAALELRPEGHLDRSTSLNNLAGSLHTRFEQHGQSADLDEAIEHHRAVLDLRPEGHPDRSTSLNNLAGSLHTRFEQHGRSADLDEAIEHHRAALNLFPEGHPNRSASLKNLASSLLSESDNSGNVDTFEECMLLLEQAAVHRFSGLVVRFEAASQWANRARNHSHHTTSRAFKLAILLLQQAAIKYGILTLDAVAYAVEGNRLEEAIEILEQGRGLLWSQMRGFRTPLDRLTETNRELADRFKNVSRQLEHLATASPALQLNSNATGSRTSGLDVHRERKLSEERLKLKKQLSGKQEEIINKIQQIPGFENFLAATPFKVLQQAASEGPVIVVNLSRYRSDVLIVLSCEESPVVCVPLDGEFAKDSVKLFAGLVGTRMKSGAESPEYDKVLRSAMKVLWDRVVSKVVDKLKELGIAEGSRIWWCPTSWLSTLPFHAAGPFEDTDGGTKYLLDKYISSYTPSLGALINARLDGSGGDPTVLVIGDTSLSIS
ncbi:TPR-like protein, partial [Fomitiporia mediterranea MF3/22]